eukprot:jgi/Mesvir1/17385/Mv08686-RA.1
MSLNGQYRSSYISPTSTDVRRGTVTENSSESLRVEKLHKDRSRAELSASARSLSPPRRYVSASADNWDKYMPTASLPTNVARAENVHVNGLRAPRQEVIYPGHYGGGNTYSRHTNVDNFVEERPTDFSAKNNLLKAKGTYMTETMARQQHAQRVYAEQVARRNLVDNRDRVSQTSDHRSMLASSLRGSASIIQPLTQPRDLWGTSQAQPGMSLGSRSTSLLADPHPMYRSVSHITYAGDRPEFQATRRPLSTTQAAPLSPSKWSAPRPVGGHCFAVSFGTVTVNMAQC